MNGTKGHKCTHVFGKGAARTVDRSKGNSESACKARDGERAWLAREGVACARGRGLRMDGGGARTDKGTKEQSEVMM